MLGQRECTLTRQDGRSRRGRRPSRVARARGGRRHCPLGARNEDDGSGEDCGGRSQPRATQKARVAAHDSGGDERQGDRAAMRARSWVPAARARRCARARAGTGTGGHRERRRTKAPSRAEKERDSNDLWRKIDLASLCTPVPAMTGTGSFARGHRSGRFSVNFARARFIGPIQRHA